MRKSLLRCISILFLFLFLTTTYTYALKDNPLLDQISSLSKKVEALARASGDMTNKLLNDPSQFLKDNPEIHKKLIHLSEKMPAPSSIANADSAISYEKMFYSFPAVAETTTKLGVRLFGWYMLYRTVENVYNFFTLYEEVQTLIEKNEFFTKHELESFINNELGAFVTYVDETLEKQQIFLNNLEHQPFYVALILTPFRFGQDFCLSSEQFQKLTKEINSRSSILSANIQKLKEELVVRKEKLEKKRGWLDMESKNNYKDIFISGVALTTGLILPASIMPMKTIQLFAPFVISSLTNLGINYLFLNPQKAKIDVQLQKLMSIGSSLEQNGKQFEEMMKTFENTLKIVDVLKQSPWLMFKWNYFSFVSSMQKTMLVGADYVFIQNWNLTLIISLNAFTIWWTFCKKKEIFGVKTLSRAAIWMFLQYFAVNLIIAFNISLKDEISQEANLARIRFQNLENQIQQECSWNNLSLWQQLIMTGKAFIKMDMREISSNAQGILVSDSRCQRLREKLSFNSTISENFNFDFRAPLAFKSQTKPAKIDVNLRNFQFIKASKKWTIYFKVLFQGIVMVFQETFESLIQFLQYAVDETSLDAKLAFVGSILLYFVVRRILR